MRKVLHPITKRTRLCAARRGIRHAETLGVCICLCNDQN
jgi:hypothetical protein